MTAKRLVLRRLVYEDVDAATTYYTQVAGHDVALRFAEQLQAARQKIAAMPSTGSAVLAHDLGIADLRSRKLVGFPYLILYIEKHDHIAILRVLHAQRDISTFFRDPAH